ncbi:hypothetical protein J2T21_001140 [Paeniglutamicibacter psychrophenolicus]|nr:hypothetical protein [Paeniglutamicibacter psychrophenolicus]
MATIRSVSGTAIGIRRHGFGLVMQPALYVVSHIS